MRRRNRDRGFTLIELLIVVTIILIIAAFTIPKITKAQIPAHEASAIASIKAINAGEMMYSSSHPDQGFTADLAMLGGTAQGGGEQTIDTQSRQRTQERLHLHLHAGREGERRDSLVHHHGGSRPGRQHRAAALLLRRVRRDPLQRFRPGGRDQPGNSVKETSWFRFGFLRRLRRD